MKVAIEIANGLRASLIDDLTAYTFLTTVGPGGLTAVCPGDGCGFRDPKRQTVSIGDSCPLCGSERLEMVDEGADIVVAIEKGRLLEALRSGKAAIQLITDSREQRPFVDLDRGFPAGKFGWCRIFPNPGEAIAAIVVMFLGERNGSVQSWRPGNGYASGRAGHG